MNFILLEKEISSKIFWELIGKQNIVRSIKIKILFFIILLISKDTKIVKTIYC
jgi:hypothetical protein